APTPFRYTTLFRSGQAVHDHLDLVELVAALDAAHVAPRAHVLSPEAGGVRDVAPRQRREVDRLLPVARHEPRLRAGHEPEVVELSAVQVLVEVGQLAGRDERLALGDERRVDLGEAGGDLEIDHPRDQAALERRARAAQHVEARARELRPARDVEDAERLAELPVRLRREGELLRLVLTDDDIVVLVLPLRYPPVE